MKTKPILLTALLALTAAFTAHAVPISQGGYVIEKPGAYRLTRNISALVPAGFGGPVGVAIKANDVELDLAGLTIGPTNSVGIGIYLFEGVRRVRVRNGRIAGVQFAIVSPANKTIAGCLFEHLQIQDCTNNCISIEGNENVIRFCTVTNVAAQKHGIIVTNKLAGFNEVSDCTVSAGVFAGTGINSALTDGLVVRRCIVKSFEEGYRVTSGCKLFDNVTMGCATPIFGNPVLMGVNN